MAERTNRRAGSRRAPNQVRPSRNSDPSPALRLVWLVAAVLWALVAASVLSFSPGDFPNHGAAAASPVVNNWIGPVGSAIAGILVGTVGSGIWFLIGAIGLYLFLIAFRGPVSQVPLRALGILMVALTWSGFHALLFRDLSRMPEGGGGILAIWAADALEIRFGRLGASLWILLLGVVGLTVAFDRWLVIVPQAIAHVGRGMSERSKVRAAAVAERIRLAREEQARTTTTTARQSDALKTFFGAVARLRARGRTAAAGMNAVGLDEELPAPAARPSPKPAPARKPRPEPAALPPVDDDTEPGMSFDAVGAPDSDHDQQDEDDDRSFTPDELREKIARLPIRFAGADKRSATQADLDDLRAVRLNEEQIDARYQFPPLSLLENPEENYNAELEAYVREQAESLEGALQQYGIKGEVVGIDSGPVVTLFQVRLAPGTKVSSVTSVSSDIARAMRSVNIRIVANTEGSDTVGIEVPNRKKEKVRIKELMTTSEATARMKLPLFLGKDASGNPLVTDLASLPHLLIAGTTGSGKSVCMNAIIMGFLYTQKPSDMKLVLVDPKMVELSQFKDIPHLMCPVVTDMSKAAAILEWAVQKMDERYELLAEAGCRDIAAYNSLGWDELKERFRPQSELEEARIPKKLPYMVYIVDELADLIMTNKEVEGSIVRIAQKARAVGIHLILATQRPQANVVTGLIKSNMPGRVSFKVASGMDSRIVLDQKGGELLLGQGDMLMITPRSSQPMRAQGTLVDDAEIRRVVKFVRDVSSPTFERSLIQLRSAGTGATPEDYEARMRQSAEEDPLFDKAVEIVLETQRGSVSLLQRRLAIGYTRASRLIELMGIAGILGDHKGSVARECLMTVEEWQAMKAQAEADAQDAAPAPGAKKDSTLFAPWEGGPMTTDPKPGSVLRPKADDFDPDEPDTDDEDEGEEIKDDVDVEAESGAEVVALAEEEEEEEEEESDEDDELVDEADDSVEEEDEDGEDEEDDDEYEYEYEYVEVDDDGSEAGDEEEDEEEAEEEEVDAPTVHAEVKTKSPQSKN